MGGVVVDDVRPRAGVRNTSKFQQGLMRRVIDDSLEKKAKERLLESIEVESSNGFNRAPHQQWRRLMSEKLMCRPPSA